jgi:hypothetical protein
VCVGLKFNAHTSSRTAGLAWLPKNYVESKERSQFISKEP